MRIKLGKVGTFSDMMNNEFAIWRAVKAGIPLSELNTWDLEELDLFMSYLDYERDAEMAVTKAMRDQPKE